MTTELFAPESEINKRGDISGAQAWAWRGERVNQREKRSRLNPAFGIKSKLN